MAGFLEKSGLLRSVLDAMPLPVFVVDREFHLLDRNVAGQAFLESVGAGSVRQLRGDELHCLNGLTAPAGCGSGPACPQCVLRRTVTESAGRTAPHRQGWKLERLDEKGSRS
jgi:PAS domain-containing protein